MRPLAATLALALATLGCASAADRERANPDYAVYSTVLDQVLAATARTAYVVRPVAYGSAPVAEALERIPEAPASLVASFRERNQANAPLDAALFRARKPVLLTGDSAFQRLVAAGDADDPLPPPFPAEGVLTLSRVGYSADGSRAAVHAAFACGARCGGGTLVVLERVGRTWIVLARHQTFNI